MPLINSFSDLSALAATPGPCLGVVAAPLAVPSSFTVPANVFLRFEPPGRLDIADGAVLTLRGHVEAPPYQIFAGRVQLDNGAVQDAAYVEWWGAISDADFGGGGTDSAPAINAAILALPPWGGTVILKFAGHLYRVGSTLNIINNPANNYRRGLHVRGKWWGRRSWDNGCGTWLLWSGNATDPLMKLHSSACRVEGLVFGATQPLDRCIDVDAPPDEANAQIVTANHFLRCWFQGHQPAPVRSGVVFGLSGIDNDEFHRFDSCAFQNLTYAGVEVPNGTGQSFGMQFHDCTWSLGEHAYASAISQAHFIDCNFDQQTVSALFFNGGSFGPCTVVRGVSENCTQFMYGPGCKGVAIRDSRLAPNLAPAEAPAYGGEWVCAGGDLILQNNAFDTASAGFRLRPGLGRTLILDGQAFDGPLPLADQVYGYNYSLATVSANYDVNNHQVPSGSYRQWNLPATFAIDNSKLRLSGPLMTYPDPAAPQPAGTAELYYQSGALMVSIDGGPAQKVILGS